MHCIVYHTVNNLRRLVLSLVAVLLLLALPRRLRGAHGWPSTGQGPDVIAYSAAQERDRLHGRGRLGPITSLNPFSPSNGQLDDYLQSMVYLPLFLFSPVTGILYSALGENFTVTEVTVPASLVYGP